jgi:predicted translin family RNA/ssDNA-binding protein
MRRDVRQDIKTLQAEIINDESKIIEFMHCGKYDLVRKRLSKIESDLKYLSIIANGAPIDKNEDRKIMDFLRIHYENIHNLSLSVR